MVDLTRYANIVLKKADIPLHKRAGELTEEEVEKLITIMQVSTRLSLQISSDVTFFGEESKLCIFTLISFECQKKLLVLR